VQVPAAGHVLPPHTAPVRPGWAFSTLVVVPETPSSWTHLLDNQRIASEQTATTVGATQLAAVVPLLTAMETRRWSGLSVIYVCPLKALLNNLLPRLSGYAGWLGRRVAIWHGDVGSPGRQRILRDPPDVEPYTQAIRSPDGIAEAEVKTYLTKNIDYSLDAENLSGLDLFFHLAHEFGMTESNRPVTFIAEKSGEPAAVESIG